MKKFPQILLSVVLFASCTVEPTESITSRSTESVSNLNNTASTANSIDVNAQNTQTVPAFMSGNLNGLQYDNLRPITYFDATSHETSVEVYTRQLAGYNYLLIQGSTTIVSNTPNPDSILVNIRIPESQWAIGTYDLQDSEAVIMDGTNSCVQFIALGSNTKSQSVTGSLTVTEFNLVTRTIKGTFNFSYYNNNNGTIEGPYHLTNGTFNYKLDTHFFD